MPILASMDLNDIVRPNTQKGPIDPMEVVTILSGKGIGCTQAIIKIVIPPMPNRTIRNMSNDLSPTAFGSLFNNLFDVFNGKDAIWLAVN